MIDPHQFRRLLVRPTLQVLDYVQPGIWSEDAEDLMMGTAAHESRMGSYLQQVGGPAMGFFQLEEATADDIVNRYLQRPENEGLLEIIEDMSYHGLPVTEFGQLKTNMVLGCALARIKYWMVPEPLPEGIEDLASYWKKHYNTSEGAGTVNDFVENYQRYCD